ncbi:hypothetical protein ATO13_21961 [Stappia sp. 22II-S9-Z10]|nr:hypothetical protein ATO13_21961 [Stappia sp. 22II-S9-Z10]
MSNWQGRVELLFGGEARPFRLGNRELFMLQDRTGVGPAALWTRLRAGTWMLGDVREIIRLGLEGAGMKPNEAIKLVEAYVDARPRMECVPTATDIIAAALWLPPDLDRSQGKGESDGTRKADSPSP